jgi:hypothetical protein
MPTPGILLNEHIVEDGPTVFAHACQLARGWMVPIAACRVWNNVCNTASIAVQQLHDRDHECPRGYEDHAGVFFGEIPLPLLPHERFSPLTPSGPDRAGC